MAAVFVQIVNIKQYKMVKLTENGEMDDLLFSTDHDLQKSEMASNASLW